MNKKRYRFKIGELVKIKVGINAGRYAFILSRDHGESNFADNNYRVMVQSIEYPQYYSELYLERAE